MFFARKKQYTQPGDNPVDIVDKLIVSYPFSVDIVDNFVDNWG